MPKRILDGKELQGFIKLRQEKQVARLGFTPKLVIVSVGYNEVSSFYTKVKQNYGADIGIEVELINLQSHDELSEKIRQLNKDEGVEGVVVQLPIEGLEDPQESLNLIERSKDIDGLGLSSAYTPATALAIIWLLNGYNIELNQGKKIVIVGKGKLVGHPLFELMQRAEYNVEAIDEFTEQKEEIIDNADIVVSAAGSPGLITSGLLKEGVVVIDAGTSSENGTQIGDVAEEVFERDDVTSTPQGGKGGVGPLTVSALFDNLIISASKHTT